MSVYSVRSGDTLSQIAQRMGSTVQKLAKVNDIQDPNVIQVDQQLKIPGQQPLNIPGQRDEYTPPSDSTQKLGGPAPTGNSSSSTAALDKARGLIGRAYGDPSGASGEAVGPNSPFMHCAQFVNAVYPDLPPSAPQLTDMATPGAEPKAGDVLCSDQPAPWGHVGIMTEKGTVIHSIPGTGVHESLAEFEASSPVTGVIPR
jgi:murein DD-endopeptidase MepM/ murein hydrolase activator NlpD